ncbi:hypothetical protein H5410_001532 [Solanum commersonii]|uniref:Uncharacterized protein n=1 Tax=Solanum commersonii TaxID=4109 RepID=A0A9J6B0D6_SOLCO|nr:hypothetical protein H5410_001532 [Solanum commersonii]
MQGLFVGIVCRGEWVEKKNRYIWHWKNKFQINTSPHVDLVNNNLGEELEKLRNGQISLMVELEKLKEWSDKSEVHILRGLNVGLGINFSCAEQWRPTTEEGLYVAGRLTCIFCYGPSSNDTRNRPRLVESPGCVAGSVQDWIGRWKARFLCKEKL